jgi:hypothetical protein
MKIRGIAVTASLSALIVGGSMFADGSESLGPATIQLATGTGIVSAGTGLHAQPGTINLEVPAGATVKQVLLYWEGFNSTADPADDTIGISNGGPATDVIGTLIGGPTEFFSGAWASVFRADITALNLVNSGVNSLSVGGLNFTAANNGAGVIVIFDDGSTATTIDIRDGSDLAFEGFVEPLKSTVAQTFNFAASNADRTAQLHMFFASVSGTLSGFGVRPTAIEITTNGPNGTTTVLNDLLDSVDGEEWDSFNISADIPAGATTLTLQAFSRDDLNTGRLPASFDWLAAGFAIEADEPPGVPGRMTGGGSVFTIGGARVTRGFEIHCDLREPNNIEVNWPGNKFHMTELTSAVCLDSPAIEEPPTAPFDTFIGTGDGKLNNQPGARIEFVFVDAGEPGSSDTASIKVYDSNDNLVLDVPGDSSLPGFIDRGNLQAHKDNKSLF